MSSILVTGATGFIGRHLVPRLIADGHVVRGLYRSARAAQPMPSVEWISVGDLASVSDWAGLLEGCDIVIHLAGLAHQAGPAGRGRLGEFMSMNAHMPSALAGSMAAQQRRLRIVFVSSVGAVASTSDTALTETTKPCPDTDYGISKLNGERAIVKTLRGTSVDWTILRPPLVYGRGDPGNLARLARLVRARWPIPLGAATGRRSLVYVGNLVDAIAICAVSPAAARRTYFVADEEQVSLRELLLEIGRVLGRDPMILHVPVPLLRVTAMLFEGVSRASGKSFGLDQYALSRLLAGLTVDAAPIRNEIGWQPPFTLQDGLRATFTNDR